MTEKKTEIEQIQKQVQIDEANKDGHTLKTNSKERSNSDSKSMYFGRGILPYQQYTDNHTKSNNQNYNDNNQNLNNSWEDPIPATKWCAAIDQDWADNRLVIVNSTVFWAVFFLFYRYSVPTNPSIYRYTGSLMLPIVYSQLERIQTGQWEEYVKKRLQQISTVKLLRPRGCGVIVQKWIEENEDELRLNGGPGPEANDSTITNDITNTNKSIKLKSLLQTNIEPLLPPLSLRPIRVFHFRNELDPPNEKRCSEADSLIIPNNSPGSGLTGRLSCVAKTQMLELTSPTNTFGAMTFGCRVIYGSVSIILGEVEKKRKEKDKSIVLEANSVSLSQSDDSEDYEDDSYADLFLLLILGSMGGVMIRTTWDFVIRNEIRKFFWNMFNNINLSNDSTSLTLSNSGTTNAEAYPKQLNQTAKPTVGDSTNSKKSMVFGIRTSALSATDSQLSSAIFKTTKPPLFYRMYQTTKFLPNYIVFFALLGWVLARALIRLILMPQQEWVCDNHSIAEESGNTKPQSKDAATVTVTTRYCYYKCLNCPQYYEEHGSNQQQLNSTLKVTDNINDDTSVFQDTFDPDLPWTFYLRVGLSFLSQVAEDYITQQFYKRRWLPPWMLDMEDELDSDIDNNNSSAQSQPQNQNQVTPNFNLKRSLTLSTKQKSSIFTESTVDQRKLDNMNFAELFAISNAVYAWGGGAKFGLVTAAMAISIAILVGLGKNAL